jgi:RNA polymerase sigma factor (sigma-70 family)
MGSCNPNGLADTEMKEKASKAGEGETTYELVRTQPEQGVELLYRKYGRKLYHYAIQSWKMNEDHAWEMVYQSLYKTVEKIHDYVFRTEKEFSSFLFTVFCNLLRRHYRDTRTREESLKLENFSESLFDESKVNPALHTERNVQDKLVERSMDEFREESAVSPLMKALEEGLAKLEEWERMLLLLRSQNLPYNEISVYLNKPADQLKVYYHRCRKKLEDIMDTGKLKSQSNEV